MMLRPVTRNSRTSKRAMLYDGHNRRPGVSARNDTMKWRRLRRRVKRWLTDRMEGW
jgi:hypothetical protein